MNIEPVDHERLARTIADDVMADMGVSPDRHNFGTMRQLSQKVALSTLEVIGVPDQAANELASPAGRPITIDPENL